MWDVIAGVLAGVLAGAATAFFGYLKSAGEKFQPKKAAQTIIVGGVVGGIAGYMGWTYEQAYEWASTVGIITLVEYIKKAIWKRIKAKWSKGK